MSPKTILVTGSTGKQGRALIAALASNSDSADLNQDYIILALTRNRTSSAAQALARQYTEHQVKIVQGDLESEESIRRIFEDAGGKGAIWGVFCVLAFPGLGANADGEQRQGEMLANLSLEYQVSAYICSSVERGGEDYDDNLDLDRTAKVRVERHIQKLGEQGLRWTILRPAFFMENFNGTIGTLTATVLKNGLKPTTAIQLVAVNDIGRVAAAVFKDFEQNASKVLVVEGDRLTMAEQDAAHIRVIGHPLPTFPAIIGRLLIRLNKHTKRLISDIERVHSRNDSKPADYAAQVVGLKAVVADMTTFEKWALQRKEANAGKESQEGWNGVSVRKLVTGKL